LIHPSGDRHGDIGKPTLIVKIELHSAVTGQVTTLATGKIVNTGTGSPTQGNYRIELRDAAGRVWKTRHIENFPRKRLLA